MCEAKNSEAEMDDDSVTVELEAQADDDADVDADADADDDDNNGDLDEADSENELDADREESDQQTIDSIIASLRAEDALTADDKRVGHAAVNKVALFFISTFHISLTQSCMPTDCSFLQEIVLESNNPQRLSCNVRDVQHPSASNEKGCQHAMELTVGLRITRIGTSPRN